ncbi:benenodin family lasso peptide [Asticcacaulis machinosus]|uniref:Benenodin family lasso peptide n=1 Tax=Asticcacaulis machinosus TaxID=2984211 RepID=A0ABT5HHC8_9CAUL|nr:benenodin family lasso peptide [Asticcacaulis machinosus]MDC7675521.1 benenodin family lasso peptide [Asticcacaulis machinosus]
MMNTHTDMADTFEDPLTDLGRASHETRGSQPGRPDDVGGGQQPIEGLVTD